MVAWQLHVFTDGGRVCRPLFVVETLESGLQKLVIRKNHFDEVQEMEERLAQYEDEGYDESVTEEELKVMLWLWWLDGVDDARSGGATCMDDLMAMMCGCGSCRAVVPRAVHALTEAGRD